MTNAEKFKCVFGLYATELWAMGENDMLKWLNAECKEPDRKNGYRDGYKRGKRAGYKKGRERNRGRGEWTEKNVIHEDEADRTFETWQTARCSNCGKYHTTPYLYYFDNYNYCPNCGARMEEGGTDGKEET